MKKLVYLFVLSVGLFSCKGEKALELTVEDIDVYVDEKLGPDQMYDVGQSLRFSRDEETYEVVRYVQEDTVVLYLETHTTAQEQVVRQTFFKEGLPVFVDEYISSNVAEEPFMQRKVYLDGSSIMECQERKSASEFDLEYMEFAEGDVALDAYDFDKPGNAMEQRGEFELKFEEFLNIPPQKYMILENESSKYNVALFVSDEPNALITTFELDPEAHKGETVFITHQFILMNGIERMLFVEGKVAE